MRIRFGTRNAPESRKRGLLRDRLARARRVQAWAIRRRIDACAIQEAGTYAEIVDGEQPSRKLLWAQFNALVRGRQVGNGVDVDRLRWKARLLEDLVIGDLHIAVVLLTHRRSGFKFKFYAVHKPTKRAANRELRPAIDTALRQHVKRDNVAGTPWVVAGDFNGALHLGVALGDHGPDHIHASWHFDPLGQRVVGRRVWSDHHFLIADAEVDLGYTPKEKP